MNRLLTENAINWDRWANSKADACQSSGLWIVIDERGWIYSEQRKTSTTKHLCEWYYQKRRLVSNESQDDRLLLFWSNSLKDVENARIILNMTLYNVGRRADIVC